MFWVQKDRCDLIEIFRPPKVEIHQSRASMAIPSKPTSEQKSDLILQLCCVVYGRVARLDLLHSMKGPFKFKLIETRGENADLG